MGTGTLLPLAHRNILSCVNLGSNGTFHSPWKWRALRRTMRVSSVREPGARNLGMVSTK